MTWRDIWQILLSVLLPSTAAITLLTGGAYLASRLLHRKDLPGRAMFFVAFASLGVTVGFAAGFSREAVLGATLPALLTVVSVMLTYLFTREGLLEWRPAIPYAISILALGGLTGLSFGSTLRGNVEYEELLNKRKALRYERVDLTSEIAEYLAELEVWKRECFAEIEARRAAGLMLTARQSDLTCRGANEGNGDSQADSRGGR